MADQIESLRAVLKRIRDEAEEALSNLAARAEARALGWRCVTCGNVKHFTRPALREVAPPCFEEAHSRIVWHQRIVTLYRAREPVARAERAGCPPTVNT